MPYGPGTLHESLLGSGRGRAGRSGAATLIDGDQASNSASNSGAVYLFTYSTTGSSWEQAAYVKASNTQAGDRFGDVLCLDGGSLIVGANYEDSGAVGIGGDQASNSASTSGAVYVYRIAP